MEKIIYYYENYENRELDEEKRGYAEVSLISAEENSKITNLMINESLKGGRKKTSIDFAGQSFEMNKKHIHGIFNVKNPLTDKVIEEISIVDLYKKPEFRELYEELSNAIGDLSQLKDGLKKS